MRQSSPAVYLAQRPLGSLQAALITKLFLNLLFAQAQDRSLQTPQEPNLPATRVSDLITHQSTLVVGKGAWISSLKPQDWLVPLPLHACQGRPPPNRVFPPCCVLGISTAEIKRYEPLYTGGLLIYVFIFVHSYFIKSVYQL